MASQAQETEKNGQTPFEERCNKLMSSYENISTRRYKMRDNIFGILQYKLADQFWDIQSWHSGLVPKLILNLVCHCFLELQEHWLGLIPALTIFLYSHLNGIVVSLILILLNRIARLSNKTEWRQIHSQLRERFLWQSLLPIPIFMRYFLETEIRYHFADKESKEIPESLDFNIFLVNHYSRMDSAFCNTYILTNRIVHRAIARGKSVFFPAFATAYWPTDYPFVEAGSQTQEIREQILPLLNYEQMNLTLMAEGNWPNNKLMELACQHCKQKGIKPYKYHLVPRSKAFIASVCTIVQGLREQNEQRLTQGLPKRNLKLFNVQCLQPVRWKFWDLVRCRKFNMDICFEQIQLKDEHLQEALKSKDLHQDCPKLRELLFSVYRRKDELVDRYNANERHIDELMCATGTQTVSLATSDMILCFVLLICNLKLVWFMWTLTGLWSLLLRPLLWSILITGIILFVFCQFLFSLDY